MALTPETEAEILRRHHADHWPVGTIAAQLNLHRDSVTRVLVQAGLPSLHRIDRPSLIDPYRRSQCPGDGLGHGSDPRAPLPG